MGKPEYQEAQENERQIKEREGGWDGERDWNFQICVSIPAFYKAPLLEATRLVPVSPMRKGAPPLKGKRKSED